jgi:hypothetical protein
LDGVDSETFIKYQCLNDTTVSLQTFTNSSCIEPTYHVLLDAYVAQTADNVTYTFDCSGYEGCSATYRVACDLGQDQLVVTPVSTCLINDDQLTSFKFDCNEDEILYWEYADNNCTEESQTLPIRITECQFVDSRNESWQFWGCNPAPTPPPTRSPTTLSPSYGPSTPPTAYPTWDVPVSDFNLSEIITPHENAASPLCAIRVWWISVLTAVVALYFGC